MAASLMSSFPARSSSEIQGKNWEKIFGLSSGDIGLLWRRSLGRSQRMFCEKPNKKGISRLTKNPLDLLLEPVSRFELLTC